MTMMCFSPIIIERSVKRKLHCTITGTIIGVGAFCQLVNMVYSLQIGVEVVDGLDRSAWHSKL
jgi:hypothetical protein